MASLAFILGRQPDLSLAELDSVFEGGRATDKPVVGRSFCVFDKRADEPVPLMQKLGGVVKIGRVVGLVRGLNDLRAAIGSSAWVSQHLPRPRHRVEFGVSVYDLPDRAKVSQSLGRMLKQTLASTGYSVRQVNGAAGEISSVAVAHNGLIARGFELLVLPTTGRIFLATTAAVQPFRELGKRDYGRPERDHRGGMLPPKLALMMINLARRQSHDLIIDPFCGSGTVLQEAWRLGFHNLRGSDIDPKAVEGTKKNLAWLEAAAGQVLIENKDATKLHQLFKAESVEAIVTEPDLGPPWPVSSDDDLSRRLKRITLLYRSFLIAASKIIKPTGRIVMVWPVFHYQGQLEALRMREVIPAGLRLVWPFSDWVPRSARQTLTYERSGQWVGREVIILGHRRRKESAERNQTNRRTHLSRPFSG